MENKRKFVRFDAPLYVKYNKDADSRQFQGVSHDVSMGGVRMAVEKELKLKDQDMMQLYFLLPGNTLAVTGKVAWVKEEVETNEVGVAFQEFPDAHKEAIYQHIFKHHRSEITQKWWQF
jgi:c-di-GMP-binding flagellar brake protein YcgR